MYLVHEPDPETPLVDTMRVLDELVRDGLVGSIGASNVDRSIPRGGTARSPNGEGLARFEWVQNSYSMLDRSDEAGVLPFCAEHGLGYTPFSPLAGGWLTGKYTRDQAHPEGSRMTMRPGPYEHLQTDAVYDGLDALAADAERRGIHMSTLATAWVLSHPSVTGDRLRPAPAGAPVAVRQRGRRPPEPGRAGHAGGALPGSRARMTVP